MSLRSQAARGLKWQAIEIGGRQVLSLFVFTTLAHLLNPSDFGLVSLVGIYLAFVGMFVDQGIGTAIIQRKELKHGHLDAAFWLLISSSVVLCVCTISLAGPIARFFAEPKLETLLRWASPALVINALAGVHHTLFFREMDFRRPAIRTLVGNLAGGAVGVGMAFAGCGVWALIGQQVTAALAGTVFLWAASPWRPRLSFSLMRLRELMAVSVSVFSVGFLWFFSNRLDQIAVGRFFGADILGQYTVGGKLADLLTTAVQQPIGAISLPTLSRLQDDCSRMCEAIYKGMELNALVSFAIYGGVAAVAPDLVPFAFGAKWELAGGMCVLLSLYALVNALQVFFHPALIASGGPGAYVVLNVIHALGVVLACFAGVRYGVNCLVVGLIVNGIAVAIPALFFLQRRIGLSIVRYCQPCVIPMTAVIMMGCAVWSIHSMLTDTNQRPARLASEIVVGAIVYLTTISVFKPSSLAGLVEVVSHALGRASVDTSTSSVVKVSL